MKLQDNPNLPGDMPGLVRQLTRLWREVASQVNSLSEGSVYATYNAATAPPTGGTYAQGDVIRNSAPVETGTVGSKYVVTGWIAVAGGTPGTWVPMRTPTGN